jgi:protein-disulfide isomerase
MILRPLLSCLALLALFAVPATAPAQKKAAATDWSRTVTLSAEGAFILGNPKARTRIVEYFSYTCSHCAHFAAEATTPLKTQWIKRGLVALEFRNFVRDPFDITAAMLARCGGAARFVGNHDALFANFEAWMTQAQAYAQKTPPSSTDRVAQMADIADKTGLFALLAKRGLTPATQRQCLADKQAMNQVMALTASLLKQTETPGTPYLMVNGKQPEGVYDWATLRATLPPLPSSGN